MASSDVPQQARGASVDHGREPCPDRILDDMGGAFGMGAVGGGLWHFFKGLKNSPSNARMRGGLEVSCIYKLMIHMTFQHQSKLQVLHAKVLPSI